MFSSNAAPFEPERSYSPFGVFALLEHHGDFAAASSALRGQGFGGEAAQPSDVDLSGILAPRAAPPPEPGPEDPGPLPEDLLRVPGFVSEVMDYSLETAPYPNPVMAFCGALALQAFLAGRKVRDPGDNRTNIYLLGLAYSAAGDRGHILTGDFPVPCPSPGQPPEHPYRPALSAPEISACQACLSSG